MLARVGLSLQGQIDRVRDPAPHFQANRASFLRADHGSLRSSLVRIARFSTGTLHVKARRDMHHIWQRMVCVIGISTAGCVSASHQAARAPTPANPQRNDALREEHARLLLAPGRRAETSLSTLPLVRGSIAGKATLMAVDTGSGANVIGAWLARSLKIETTKVTEPTHDPSGRPLLMERDDRPQLRIDGFDPLGDRPTAVIDLPAAFEAAGIGIILSPQMLANADLTLVIDMPAREMRRFRANASSSNRSTKEESVGLDGTSMCNQSGAGFEGRMLSTSSVIDGIPTSLAVDTGAIGSTFFLAADSDAGKKVLAREGGKHESGFSAAGKLDVTTAHEVPVRMGNKEWKTDVTVMPGRRDACGTEGRLGLDYLSACVFSIRERSYELHCK
jgi:hypothetical protein